MRVRHERIAAGVVLFGLVLAGCRGGAGEEGNRETDVATVEPIEGSDVARVTLSEDAARRLDIQTEAVKVLPGSGARLTIPYAAVLYDADGDTWAYSNPGPRSSSGLRSRSTGIEGDEAILSDGPPPGPHGDGGRRGAASAPSTGSSKKTDRGADRED